MAELVLYRQRDVGHQSPWHPAILVHETKEHWILQKGHDGKGSEFVQPKKVMDVKPVDFEYTRKRKLLNTIL